LAKLGEMPAHVHRVPWARRYKRVRTALGIVIAFLALTLKPSDAAPIVHPGDTLSVDVLNYAAVIDDSQGRLKGLNADSVVVAADGSISIPVIGTLDVAGKTTHEVSQVIEARLASYVRDPTVNVRLLTQGQNIFLTGATTGTLPFLPGETLSSALGQLREQFTKGAPPNVGTSGQTYGGTLARSAVDLRRIVLERDNNRGDPINGEDLLRSGLPGPSLVPGDTLLFASKPVRVDVRGEVAAPGAIYLYQADTLEEALLAAGGPLPTASTVDASLIRDGKDVPLPLGGAALRQAPQTGDTVVVRAAPHVTVLGQVPTPGELTLKNGSTLLSALYVAGGPTRWANVKDVQVVHEGARHSYDLSHLPYGDLSTNIALDDGDVVYVPEGHKIDPRVFLQALGGIIGSAYDVRHL
jgi:protein involved in polysaccharide export with SLBB domain